MALIVLSSDVSGSSTVVLSSKLISAPFRVRSVTILCSTGGNTRIKVTPLVALDDDSGTSPVSGSSLFSSSSSTDFVYTSMHHGFFSVNSPIIDAGHYLKAKIVNEVTGARPVTVSFDIEFVDREPVVRM